MEKCIFNGYYCLNEFKMNSKASDAKTSDKLESTLASK